MHDKVREKDSNKSDLKKFIDAFNIYLHDMQDPITVGMTSIELLKKGQKDKDQLIALLERSYSSIINLSDQVKKKIDNHKLLSTINLNNYLDNIVDEISYSGSLRGHSVQIQKPLTQFYIGYNLQALRSILFYLAHNSFESFNEANILSGSIYITLSIHCIGKKNFAVIEFEDNGPGVHEKNRTSIFLEKFTLKDSKVHQGLGLYYASLLSKENNSKLILSKEKKNKAYYKAKFQLYIPMHNQKDY